MGKPITRRSRRSRRATPSAAVTRRYLALAVVLHVLLVSISTIVVPSAGDVFDKLLPLTGTILGYYFGSQQA